MLTSNPTPSPPPTSAHLTPATSPRSGRLRGLSYLRNYTQAHLSSSGTNRPTRHSLSRSVSYPAQGTTSGTADVASDASRAESSQERQDTTTQGNAASPSRGAASWLSSVGELSGLSRRGTGTQQGTIDSSSGEVNHSSSRIPTDSSESIMARRRNNQPLRATRTAGASSASSVPEPSQSGEGLRFARLDGHTSNIAPQGVLQPAFAGSEANNLTPSNMPSIRFLPHNDPRSSRPSLQFPPVSRTLPNETTVLRVGRYSEREAVTHADQIASAPVGFKSKVVSRKHCEFSCVDGQWYIKDVKSSSGTFLNHIRLSQPNMESKPFKVNDGDVIQLGIDFRGGEEQIFRCVKIKIETNRTWQKKLNNFNVNTHKRLRALGSKESEASSQSTECVICLMAIAPCQSLFVAPCSHVWHYKCIRPMLNDPKQYPQFTCPNCRAVTDLEAEVEIPEFSEGWDDGDIPFDQLQEQNAGTNMMDGIEQGGATANGSADSGTLEEPTVLVETLSVSPKGESTESIEGEETRLSASTSSLMSRRQASNVSLPRSGAGAVTAIDMPAANPPSRPGAAPSEGSDEVGREDTQARLRSPTPQSTEQITADGLLTPTNNAGPFVFDGSAGRRAGRRLTATTTNEIQE